MGLWYSVNDKTIQSLFHILTHRKYSGNKTNTPKENTQYLIVLVVLGSMTILFLIPTIKLQSNLEKIYIASMYLPSIFYEYKPVVKSFCL